MLLSNVVFLEILGTFDLSTIFFTEYFKNAHVFDFLVKRIYFCTGKV